MKGIEDVLMDSQLVNLSSKHVLCFCLVEVFYPQWIPLIALNFVSSLVIWLYIRVSILLYTPFLANFHLLDASHKINYFHQTKGPIYSPNLSMQKLVKIYSKRHSFCLICHIKYNIEKKILLGI